jgi:tetratricopeptide (TPR) repeat protein
MHLHDNQERDFYLAYSSLNPEAYRDRVRFYEENRSYLDALVYEDRVEVDLDYSFALFEIGKYQRFLDRVDRLIELVVIDNIEVEGRDIFKDLLFKKAASLYNLWSLEKAEQVISQLYKIDPEYPYAKSLFIKIRSKKPRLWYEINKALSVVAFLSGLSLLIMQQLIFEPFYVEQAIYISSLKNFLLIACVALLVLNEGAKKWRSVYEVENW